MAIAQKHRLWWQFRDKIRYEQTCNTGSLECFELNSSSQKGQQLGSHEQTPGGLGPNSRGLTISEIEHEEEEKVC